MNPKKAYQKLRDIDQKTQENISIRLGMVTLTLVDKFCKLVDINRSRYVRIAISHLDSYLSQLSDKELAEEIKKMKKFD